MNPLRHLLACLILCFASAVPCFAQKATIIEYNGRMYGIVVMPSGQTIVLKEVVILKAPTPVPTTTGLVWTIVIRTVDTMTADQSQVLSDLRQWSDQQPADKVAHFEFAPNAVNQKGGTDSSVASWVAKIPATAKQPYVFVSQKSSDGKKMVIHWQGELPASADALIAKIKEHVR
jgi:hypothetical protein